jgi:orotidine-5'-phosphate decarboxylase
MTGLIVALDVANAAEAKALLSRLGDAAIRVKVGLELFLAEGPELVRRLVGEGRKVMLDLKLHDIPETVARATARVADLGAELLTIHTGGGLAMMEAAVAAAAGRVRVLGVTVLTSMNARDLSETCVEPSVEDVVTRRATLAMEAGLDGVVASALEAAAIRAAAPEGFLIVTPGVRPAGADAHDQARVATPAGARAAGADFVVVGRPIRDAADPRAMVDAILRDLE